MHLVQQKRPSSPIGQRVFFADGLSQDFGTHVRQSFLFFRIEHLEHGFQFDHFTFFLSYSEGLQQQIQIVIDGVPHDCFLRVADELLQVLHDVGLIGLDGV